MNFDLEPNGRLTLNTCPGGFTRAGSHLYRCLFVRAGNVRAAGGGAADIAIAPAALEDAAAAGLFDGLAVFVDHAAKFDHPSLRRMVGITSSASYDPQPEAVAGCIKLYGTEEGQRLASLLDEILADQEAGNPAPDIGLSLVFYPRWQAAAGSHAAGTRLVAGITAIDSLDFVFQPAAGGKVLQSFALLPAAAVSTPPEPPTTKGEFTMDSTPNPTPRAEDTPAADEVQSLPAFNPSPLIAASALPEPAKRRLAAQVYPSPLEAQAAIETERAYLASLAADQVIQIGATPPRSPRITLGHSGSEQLEKALEAMILGVRPPQGIQPLTGIRELYHLLSGDFEMTGLFQSERVYLANVNSSTMANMVANALNKVLAGMFSEYPQWWRPIVTEMDFPSLQAIRWITLGGIGELPTVGEGAAYTEMSWDDKYETASFVKKGGYLGLTLEAIDKDDTGKLRAAPQALAQAAWLTLSRSISAIFTDNSGTGPTLSDSVALFAAGHANLGSAALSVSNWSAARLAMRKQTEVNSGERLGFLTAPRYLLVPPDLEVTALQVMASPLDYTYAVSNATDAPANIHAAGETHEMRLRSARERVIVVDLWTDTSDWAAVADPKLYPTIGVGYRYGRTPEIFSIATPAAGLMFTNDVMPVKVRFVYAAGPIDYRGLYKANV